MNTPWSDRVAPWGARLRGSLGSLKLRLTLGCLAALLLGLALNSWLLNRQAENSTLQVQRQVQLEQTAQMGHQLSERLLQRQLDLQETAQWLTPELLRQPQPLGEFLLKQGALRQRFSNLFVIQADGRVSVFVDSAGLRPTQADVSDRSYFRQAMAEGRPVISEPLNGRVSDEPVVVLVHPIRDDKGVVGLLGGSLRLASRDLARELGLSRLPGEEEAQAWIALTDARGVVLAHPDRQMLMRGMDADAHVAQAHADWVAMGSSVEPAGLMLKQPGALVTVAGVPGPDWLVWRVVPEASLLAPFHSAGSHLWRWPAAYALLLGLGLFLFLRWQFRPLRQLERHALASLEGPASDPGPWPQASGELGQLVRTLQHVAAERDQVEVFNRQLLQRLSSVLNAAPLGIAFTRNRRFELVSQEFCRLLGVQPQAMEGRLAQTIFASNEDHAQMAKAVTEAFARGESYKGEWRILREGERPFWAKVRGAPVVPGDISAGTIWTLSDIDEQVAEREKLVWSASHDALTGLSNRRLLEAEMSRLLGLPPGRVDPPTLVMIDLDRFKPINDTAGHAAGDAMLQAVATAIRGAVRSGDLVARVGGDEFAVLLGRCQPDLAEDIAEKIRLAIAALRLPWEERLLQVGASAGVASVEGQDSLLGWLRAADAACYAAKSAGRRAAQLPPRAAEPPALAMGEPASSTVAPREPSGQPTAFTEGA